MRLGPVEIKPVEWHGVRYSEDRQSAGKKGRGGYLQAHDIASGALLWTCSVYSIQRDKKWESDTQDVYMRSITVAEDGCSLLLENERSEVYSVDLQTKKSVFLRKEAVLSGRERMKLYAQQMQEQEEAEEAAAAAQQAGKNG